MVYIVATLLRKAYEARRTGWDGQDGWRRLMLTPADYAEDESALFHPLTRRLMQQIDFRHGGPEFDRRYPDGIPTTVEISHAKLGPLTSGLVMYPQGHARADAGELPRLLEHKFRLLAGPAVDDVDALVSRFTKLSQSRPNKSPICTTSRSAEFRHEPVCKRRRAQRKRLGRFSNRKNHFSPLVQSRRPRELGMFIALRYLVTVRRATVMPALPSSSTIASSDSGLVLSSLSMISCSLIRTRSQATSSPSALVVPPTKNRLSGKMPRGV